MSSADRIETLLARVALADRAAFSELYDATSAKLLGVCLKILGDRARAEDAMQDAYVKIWRNADRYRANGLSPMTWLITIARNTAIDRLRADRATTPLDSVAADLPAPGATPEAAALAASASRRIVACLSELPEDRRAAVVGCYLTGDSYADLAERFGVPLNTMRTWLRRSLIALRECMAR